MAAQQARSWTRRIEHSWIDDRASQQCRLLAAAPARVQQRKGDLLVAFAVISVLIVVFRWNRRGAMVTDRYQHVHHHETVADLAAYLHGTDVQLLGIDNLPGSLHLETMTVPRKVCFLFGQEGPGLSESARAACDCTFSIAQFGSTRSINASAAAASASR